MKIAFIGFGSIAKKHLAVIKAIDATTEIYAVRHKKTANSIDGVENISIDQLKKLGVDALILSNPSVLHAQWIEKLVSLHKPIMVEKPICTSLSQWERLAQFDTESLPLIYTACNLRFHPLIRSIKQYLIDHPSDIYEVNAYCGSYLPDWRTGTDYTQSYSAQKNMGGGVHLDLIHEIDFISYLFGLPTGFNKEYRKLSSLNISSYDYANYMLSYENFTANIQLNYFRRDAKRTLEVVRKDDTLLLDFIEGVLINLRTKEIILNCREEGMYLSYFEQMNYFLSGVKTNKKLMNSLEESLKIIHPVL